MAESPSFSRNTARASFLLVNYNMSGVVTRCVNEIEDRLPLGDSSEILIADNSSDPQYQLPPDFARRCPRVRTISCENRGWIAALNCLFPLATGKYVVIMHPDVSFEKECLQQMFAFLDNHAEVGIVAPNLFYPNGLPNRIRIRFPTLKSESRILLNTISRGLLQRNLVHDEVLWDRREDVLVDTVMSVCMVIRRELIERVGGIDSQIVGYYGNDYLSVKARSLGYGVCYLRDAKAVHFERYTPKDLYGDSKDMAYKANAIRSLPRMRADYMIFLSSLYPRWKVFGFRIIATVQDLVALVGALKTFHSRPEDAKHLWASIRVLWGDRVPIHGSSKSRKTTLVSST